MSKLIKYTLVHDNSKLSASLFAENTSMQVLDGFRTELFTNALIGVNSNGINFGNVSCRVSNGLCTQQNGHADASKPVEFLISGTATGKHRILGADGYALVTKTSCANNTVEAQGLVPPSSEALSHAAVYAACPSVNVVVHGHHAAIHTAGLAMHVPMTKATLAYGTPAVAEAIELLVAGQDAGFFIMLGHENGFFVYGRDILSVEKRCRELVMHPKNTK